MEDAAFCHLPFFFVHANAARLYEDQRIALSKHDFEQV